MKHDAVMMIARIHEQAQKMLRGELTDAGLSGVAPSHGDVLACLFARGAATMQELAAFAHRTKPTTTVLVDKLEERGLVRRTASPDDARRTVVTLTADGAQLRGAFDAISRRLVARVYGALDRAESETLERLLAKVLANLEAKGTQTHTTKGTGK